MPHTTLSSLFGHEARADAERFDVPATLPDAHVGALHTALRTLNHIHVVDRLFRVRLSGAPEPFDATNTEATPTLAQLRADVAATDAWYPGHVATLGAAALAEVLDCRFTDGDRGRMSREEILVHVGRHGGDRRGHVGQLPKSIGVAPPRDPYTRHLHQSEPARRSA